MVWNDPSLGRAGESIAPDSGSARRPSALGLDALDVIDYGENGMLATTLPLTLRGRRSSPKLLNTNKFRAQLASSLCGSPPQIVTHKTDRLKRVYPLVGEMSEASRASAVGARPAQQN